MFLALPNNTTRGLEMSRSRMRARVFTPIRALRRATSMPTITPRRGEAWIA